jgi:hypothetical protein
MPSGHFNSWKKQLEEIDEWENLVFSVLLRTQDSDSTSGVAVAKVDCSSLAGQVGSEARVQVEAPLTVEPNCFPILRPLSILDSEESGYMLAETYSTCLSSIHPQSSLYPLDLGYAQLWQHSPLSQRQTRALKASFSRYEQKFWGPRTPKYSLQEELRLSGHIPWVNSVDSYLQKDQPKEVCIWCEIS